MNVVRDIARPQETIEPVLESEDLFGPASVLTILHNGMAYTLRITRQGKLLLTK